MMRVPVIDPLEGSAFLLDSSKIIFNRLGANRRDLLFATETNTLRLVRNIKEMDKALSGTDFLRVDQDIIINMDRAISYNPKEHTLFFETAGLEKISSCHVSRDNRNKVKEWFMTY